MEDAADCFATSFTFGGEVWVRLLGENLKELYYQKIDNKQNNNTNNNRQINRNSQIFNYIRNNSELIITSCDLIEVPFNEIQQNIPENFLTSMNFSGNQIEGWLEKFQNILFENLEKFLIDNNQIS